MPDAPRTATAHSHYDEMKLEITMTQVDTPETRQDGASRWDVRLGTWRAGIRRAIRIGSRPEPWKRGLVLAARALLLALVMLLHAEIPDWRWNPRQPGGDLPAVASPDHPRAAGRGAAAPLRLRA